MPILFSEGHWVMSQEPERRGATQQDVQVSSIRCVFPKCSWPWIPFGLG